jgi:hypothetical protein
MVGSLNKYINVVSPIEAQQNDVSRADYKEFKGLGDRDPE